MGSSSGGGAEAFLHGQLRLYGQLQGAESGVPLFEHFKSTLSVNSLQVPVEVDGQTLVLQQH